MFVCICAQVRAGDGSWGEGLHSGPSLGTCSPGSEASPLDAGQACKLALSSQVWVLCQLEVS